MICKLYANEILLQVIMDYLPDFWLRHLCWLMSLSPQIGILLIFGPLNTNTLKKLEYYTNAFFFKIEGIRESNLVPGGRFGPKPKVRKYWSASGQIPITCIRKKTHFPMACTTDFVFTRRLRSCLINLIYSRVYYLHLVYPLLMLFNQWLVCDMTKLVLQKAFHW